MAKSKTSLTEKFHKFIRENEVTYFEKSGGLSPIKDDETKDAIVVKTCIKENTLEISIADFPAISLKLEISEHRDSTEAREIITISNSIHEFKQSVARKQLSKYHFKQLHREVAYEITAMRLRNIHKLSTSLARTSKLGRLQFENSPLDGKLIISVNKGIIKGNLQTSNINIPWRINNKDVYTWVIPYNSTELTQEKFNSIIKATEERFAQITALRLKLTELLRQKLQNYGFAITTPNYVRHNLYYAIVYCCNVTIMVNAEEPHDVYLETSANIPLHQMQKLANQLSVINISKLLQCNNFEVENTSTLQTEVALG